MGLFLEFTLEQTRCRFSPELDFIWQFQGKLFLNTDRIRVRTDHAMARMSGTLVSMLAYPDLINALFETLDPCEETFRYLTYLACVCKAWQSSAVATRLNRAWLEPQRQRAIAYYIKIDQARYHLDLDYFILGITEYFSSVQIQERVVPKMIVPKGTRQEDAVAIITRFKQADALKLVPLLAKVGFRHLTNFRVFYSICKISGILCQQDSRDNSQHRTQLCVEHKFLALFLDGVAVHKNTMNVTQFEYIFVAITKLAVMDIRVLHLGVYHMRCFPYSEKMAEQFLFFMVDKGCDDITEKYVLDEDILKLVIKIATKHISNQEIANASCHVLAYFALKNDEALLSVANKHGMSLLFQVIHQHTRLDTIKAYLRLLKAIARSPNYVCLLHAHDIIPRILLRLNLRNIGPLVLDADGICDFLAILSHCVCDRVLGHSATTAKLVAHGIVHILHTIMLAHVQNYDVHFAVISFLSTVSSSCSLKAQYFNNNFMQILGTNFVRCLDKDFMVAPMFKLFSVLIEKSEKGRWTDMVHQYLVHITTAMALHMDHVDIRETGTNIIMLIAQKRACRCTPLNLDCIDCILRAASFCKKKSISTFCLQALTDLMSNTEFRAHMVKHGAVFVVLEILQDADTPHLISLCLLFLSGLGNKEHTLEISFKFVLYMCSVDKHKHMHNIENAEALIAKSLECPGITDNMRKMAATIRNTKFG